MQIMQMKISLKNTEQQVSSIQMIWYEEDKKQTLNFNEKMKKSFSIQP
jgi:hypothetical protein